MCSFQLVARNTVETAIIGNVCTWNILKEFEFPEEDILSSQEAANLT